MDDFSLQIPDAVDDEGDEFVLEVSFSSQTSGYFDYDPTNKEIVRRKPLVEMEEGLYVIKVLLVDQNSKNPKTKEYQVQIQVANPIEQFLPQDDRKTELEQLVPYIQSFSSDGLLTVAWN